MRKPGYYRIKFRGTWEIARWLHGPQCFMLYWIPRPIKETEPDEINEDPIDPDPASEYQHDFKPA